MTKGICALITIATLSWSGLTFADDCNWWQLKLSRTERKINGGGNQSQVRQWNKERNYYAKELEKCNKSNGTHKWIETAGARAQNNSYKREPLRTTTTDNPQLQQVINTCNFWIQQYNQAPDENNRAMKNTACSNIDRMTNSSDATKPNDEFKAKRSLKDCVKPNNKIDGDVKLCMQGLKEPTWVRQH